MEYWDIYVLQENRELNKLKNFVIEVIPGSELVQDVSEQILLVKGTETTYQTLLEYIVAACESKLSEGGIRINGTLSENLNGGWLYFNSDGSVVLGLTVKETKATKKLKQLLLSTDSTHGYIAGDGPPPENKDEFVRLCN